MLTGPFTFHVNVSPDAADTDFAGELFFVAANKSVYHDSVRLSWVELPVAEGMTVRFE